MSLSLTIFGFCIGFMRGWKLSLVCSAVLPLLVFGDILIIILTIMFIIIQLLKFFKF